MFINFVTHQEGTLLFCPHGAHGEEIGNGKSAQLNRRALGTTNTSCTIPPFSETRVWISTAPPPTSRGTWGNWVILVISFEDLFSVTLCQYCLTQLWGSHSRVCFTWENGGCPWVEQLVSDKAWLTLNHCCSSALLNFRRFFSGKIFFLLVLIF